jgi:hypothetical protein
MLRAKARTRREQRRVDEWNDRYPVGTPVEFWSGAREGQGTRSRTSSAAVMLSGHSAVVQIEGVRGCVALSHVRPLSLQETVS